MPAKFVAVYRKPADVEAFDKHFFEVHKPLCEAVPHLTALVVNKITGTPRGDADLHMIVEMQFEDREKMMEGLMSEAGAATAKDARAFAKEVFSGYFAEA